MANRSHPDLRLVLPAALRAQRGWTDEHDWMPPTGDAKPSRELRIDQVRAAIDWSQQTSGRGRGKTVATVAGAAAGGYAGNRVQKNMQDKDVETTTERRCKTVYDTSVKHHGYDVTYRLNGKEDVVRMNHNPGTQIPVKDGKLVLEPPAAKK